MNKQLRKISNGVERPKSCSADLLHHKLIGEAKGWLYLGNYVKAEEVLSEVPECSRFHVVAEIMRLNLDHDLGRFQQGEERGRRLIRDFGVDHETVMTVINCLLFQDKYQQARTLASPCEEQWLHNINGSYTLACIESKLGNFTASLRWLGCSLQLSSHYALHALFDPHLTALWRHLGRLQAGVDSELLGILAAPVFGQQIKKGERERGFFGIGHEIARSLPPGLSEILVMNFQRGLFGLNFRMRTSHRKQFDDLYTWQRRRVLNSLASLVSAMRIAANLRGSSAAGPLGNVPEAI